MNISVPNSDVNVEMKHDLLGNVFLDYKDRKYCIAVTPNGLTIHPVKDKSLTDIPPNAVNHCKGKLFLIDKSLKSVAKEKLEKEKDVTDYEVNNNFFPEEEFFFKVRKKKKTHLCDDNDVNPFFTFYNFDKKFITSRGFHFSSNYHFLVVDGNKDSHKIIYMAEEHNNVCSYRINIHTNGTIKLNVIGDKVIYFTLIDKDDILCSTPF